MLRSNGKSKFSCLDNALSCYLALLSIALLCFIAIGNAWPKYARAAEGDEIGTDSTQENSVETSEDAIINCTFEASTLSDMPGSKAAQNSVACGPEAVADTSQASNACLARLMNCIKESQKSNASLVNSAQWKVFSSNISKEIAWRAVKEALAVSMKQALSMMARQIAHDTAVWAASGGRGQKPLFITEGWGAYVKNVGDSALGVFIDGMGSKFGLDLCQPNFKVKLAIIANIKGEKLEKPRCSFSQIAGNWQKAINNASFDLDYRTAMTANETDIGYLLIMADNKNSYVKDAVIAAAKEAEIPSLWKNIQDVAGYILTPGTEIANMIRTSAAENGNPSVVNYGEDIFTGTIADFVQTFANTLISQTLTNIKSGMFFGNGGGTGQKQNSALSGLDLNNLSKLFNPNSSPLVAGASGASERFSSLITNQVKVGSRYDILSKLTQCPEESKNNPGTTDCVIDSQFAEQIKNGVYVKDLPDGTGSSANILGRVFASTVNQTSNLENNISYRSILILRQYRIVPIGWEIAANYIKDHPNNRNYTLKNIMDCYYGKNDNCDTDVFIGMIDPYWMLKPYETYCRRQSYGARNVSVADQSLSVNRDQYCSDVQQCLQDDQKGNCSSYGYCQEERRLWNLGTTCDSRNNTCQTVQSRSNSNASWLTNSMDFANCDQNDVGCRAYSLGFNPTSGDWNGEFIDPAGKMNFYAAAAGDTPVKAGSDLDWQIPQYHSVSKNYRLKIGGTCKPELCSKPGSLCVWNKTDKTCDFSNTTATNLAGSKPPVASCTIPAGGISCMADSCFETGNNLLSTLNPSFNDGADFNADFWTDELSTEDDANRHYQFHPTSAEHAQDGDSGFLKAVASLNQTPLITTLPGITLDAGKDYVIKFWAKGVITSGGINVSAYTGSGNLYRDYSGSSDGSTSLLTTIGSGTSFNSSVKGWQEYSIYLNSPTAITATLAIITSPNSITDFDFDNFRMYQASEDCQQSSIKFFTETSNRTTNQTNKYLNRNAESCTFADEGCSQFIRTKPGLGSNLMYNGGFETLSGTGFDGWSMAAGGNVEPTTVKDFVNSGYYALRAKGDSTIFQDESDLEPMRNKIMPGHTYIFSAMVKGASVNLDLGYANPADCGTATVSTPYNPAESGLWQEIKLGFKFNSPLSTACVANFKPELAANSGSYVDNVQFEEVGELTTEASNYTDYEPARRAAAQVSYLKKAPDYLDCYKTTAGVWPSSVYELNNVLANRDPKCSRFSPVCTREEVGCELYTPTNGDPVVPGIANDIDQCPKECVGYQVYHAEKTPFVSDKFRQFIADNNAKYCSANQAGCDEFTNIDEVSKGGEGKEYYTRLKACQKPGIDDAAYYTWEGSDTTGYQLKAYRLKVSTVADPETGVGIAPCTNLTYDTATGAPLCADPSNSVSTTPDHLDFGICSVDEMANNSDCRQFYDANGNVHYRLLSHTVTASDNCHPYRRTQTQSTINEAMIDCQGLNGRQAGWWNNNECVYMAIPNEGNVCTASAKGCRAYTGSQGNNIRKVINDSSFTASVTSSDWQSGDGTKNGLNISNEATFPGGNSLTNTGGNAIIRKPVTLYKGNSYVLSFWAKGNVNFYPTSIQFANADTSDISPSGVFSISQVASESLLKSRIMIGTEWQRYEIGPVFVDWDTSDTLKTTYLQFKMPSSSVIQNTTGSEVPKIYLSSIVLKETTKNFYAIENSWYTPQSCDNKLDDADGKKAIAAGNCQDESTGRCSSGEMLGCSAYKDRLKNTWYLRSFASLCRREAAGCEALINTFNSESPKSLTKNAGPDSGSNDYDVTTVPKDEMEYLVNDSKYSCEASNKGCKAFGLAKVDMWDQVTGYSTIFLKDKPEDYDSIMCQHKQEWCEEYKSSNSLLYFKDPHGKVCDYTRPNASSTYDWFKSGTDIKCDTSVHQTFGTGYEPTSKKSQPVGPLDTALNSLPGTAYTGWAGSCPAAQSGCSEYVDPLGFIYTNLLPYQRCNATSTCELNLRANVLYYVTSSAAITFTSSDCSPVRNPINGNFVYFKAGANVKNCSVIASKSGTNFDVVNDIRSGGDKISVAGVYYDLKGSVDESSCNGLAKFGDGCVLFNDRSEIDFHYASSTDADSIYRRAAKYLTYDTFGTFMADMPYRQNSVGANPIVGAATDKKDSNTILKVAPDRTCKSWLSCSTYEKGSTGDTNPYFGDKDRCLALETCDYLDPEKKICENLAPANTDILTANVATSTGINRTGYVAVNDKPYDMMQQTGESTSFTNGNFEDVFNKTTEPVGWKRATWLCKDSSCTSGYPVANSVMGWNPLAYSVTAGDDAPEGKSYLRLNGASSVISEQIDIMTPSSSTETNTYVLSYKVSTKNLTGEGAYPSSTYAHVALRYFDNSGKQVDINVPQGGAASNPPVYWLNSPELNSFSGQDWKQVSYTFTIKGGSNIGSVEVALSNLDPNGSGGLDNTKLGGYSAWDDFTIKPVLNVNDSAETARSCRSYPTQDAKSCRFNDDTGKNYVGQYGYCMLADPDNKQQCLQWWPVDSIRGEQFSDYAGSYTDRFPLYYCVEKAYKDVDMSSLMGKMGVFGQGVSKSGLPESFKLGGSNGNEIAKAEFNMPAAWTPLFRYPFIYHFNFDGAAVAMGSTASHQPFFGFASAKMYPKMVCPGVAKVISDITGLLKGGDLANIGCYTMFTSNPNIINTATSTAKTRKCVSNGADCTNISKVQCGGNSYDYDLNACGDGTVSPDISSICSNLDKVSCTPADQDVVAQMGSALGNGDILGLIKILGGFVIDTIKNTVTDLINTCVDLMMTLVKEGLKLLIGTDEPFTFLNQDVWGGWGAIAIAEITGSFVPHVDVPWHTALALGNVGVDGLLKAISLVTGKDVSSVIKVSTFGMKIITDQDSEYAGNFTDVNPKSPNDILGYAWFWNTGSFQGAGDKTGFAILSGLMTTKARLEYCTKVVKVVDASGNNKAWAARLSKGSTYQTNDADCIMDSEKAFAKDESAATTASRRSNSDCFYSSTYCIHNSFLNTIFGGKTYSMCDDINTGVIFKIGKSGTDEAVDKDKCPSGITADCTWRLNCGSTASNAADNSTVIYDVKSCSGGGTDCTPAPNYFCRDTGAGGKLIFRRIYSYNNYKYSVDYKPYGSIVQPSNAQFPTQWDSRPGAGGNQPLFYEMPVETGAGQARMGQVHDVNNLKLLFAKSYGYWEWQGGFSDLSSYGDYADLTGNSSAVSWGLPQNACPTADGFCYKNPAVIVSTKNTAIGYKGPMKLVFTADVNSNQLPITGYSVNWGDGEKVSYSGISLANRPTSTEPISLYHSYDYYKIKAAVDAGTLTGATFHDVSPTVSNPYYAITGTVNVIDNWYKRGADSFTVNVYRDN